MKISSGSYEGRNNYPRRNHCWPQDGDSQRRHADARHGSSTLSLCATLRLEYAVHPTWGIIGVSKQKPPYKQMCGNYRGILITAVLYKTSTHGEKDFVASTKRFVDIASANQNCCGDYFTCYGHNSNFYGNNSYCCCNNQYC